MRYNPFNPQQPARPDFFVGREPEITEFERFLLQTIHGSPMNMSITGNRGMGKTSLLVKFEEMAKQKNCLVLRLSNYEGNVSDIIDFSDFIASNLKRELLSKKPFEKSVKEIKEWISALRPTLGWNDVSLSVEKKQVVQEMFGQKLRKLWGEIEKEFKAAVILIDEAESLEKIEGVFPFLREVFQRVSTESKYMLVLAGKLNFPERMSESFSPLNRFFPVSKLNPLTIAEVKTYLDRKLNTVSISIDTDALTIIANKSEGHPYVLVSMAFTVFDSLRDKESVITKEVVQRTLEKIYAQLGQDFLFPMYHSLTPKAKEVIKLITNKMNGKSFTFSEAVRLTKMGANYISPYIKEMLRKGVLNKPERGKYELFHTLFAEYIKKQSI